MFCHCTSNCGQAVWCHISCREGKAHKYPLCNTTVLYVCTLPAGWPPPIHRTHSPPLSAAPEASVHHDQTRWGSSAAEREREIKRGNLFMFLWPWHITHPQHHSSTDSHFTAQDVLVAPLRCEPQLIRHMAHTYGNMAFYYIRFSRSFLAQIHPV